MKIAIVDDHALFRNGMKSLLNDITGVEIVLEASDGAELLDKLKSFDVDIILLDLEMPVMSGLDVLPIVRKQAPDTRIMIISMHQEDQFISTSMELGAHGYLLKDAEFEELQIALTSLMESGFYFNEKVSKSLLNKLVQKSHIKASFDSHNQLTEREMEVLKLICQEMTTIEIGKTMYLSARTIEGYRTRLLEKTGAKNIAGLVVYAARNGWLEKWLI